MGASIDAAGAGSHTPVLYQQVLSALPPGAGGRLPPAPRSFAEMPLAAAALPWATVSGVLLDLGLSSMQVDDPARGFAFRLEGPPDMRFDPGQPTTPAHPGD